MSARSQKVRARRYAIQVLGFEVGDSMVFPLQVESVFTVAPLCSKILVSFWPLTGEGLACFLFTPVQYPTLLIICGRFMLGA